MLRRSVSWFASAAILIGTTPAPLYAQPVLPPQENPAPTPGQGYSVEQLESILAPIALYPDVLLTQILMASAFPLQIVEAYRWVQQGNNRQIHGEQLVVVLQSRPWDPSVKSLVPFPAVLAQMNGNLDWLQQLGFAAANQQEEVLSAVQNLRQRAYAAGSLRSNEQYVVRQEERIIYIEPPPTGVVYVPYYNPTVIYGAWSYPAYPPVYFAPQPYWGISPVLGSVLVFGAGIAVGAALWGIGHPRWDRRHIYVDHNRYNHINYGRPGWRGDERWQPRNAQSFDRGGGQRYLQGSIPGSRFDGRGGNWGSGQRSGDGARFDGRGGNWGQQFGPGGTGRRPDWDGNRQGNFAPGNVGPGRGLPPGNQFRDRGAPGTVGNSGIVPPGQQFRDRGAPGTVGNSGIVPPGRRGQDDGPGGGPGGGQNWRRQGDGSGASHVVSPGGGGPAAVRRMEGAPGGQPGGGGQSLRREGGGPGPQGGSPGGGGQNFRREAVGAPQGGGGHPGGGGGGGQTVRQGNGGGGAPQQGGGSGGRAGHRDERRGDRN